MDVIMTPAEAAERLKLSRRSIYSMLESGQVKGVKVGSRWLINGTRNWPELFGQVEPPDVMPADEDGTAPAA